MMVFLVVLFLSVNIIIVRVKPEKRCSLENIHECMSKEELLEVFGSSEEIPKYEVSELKVEERFKRSTKETLKAEIKIKNKPVELLLTKNSWVTSPEFTVITRDSTGADIHTNTEDDCMYLGTVSGDADSLVAVSKCNGSDALSGFVFESTNDYLVKPFPRIKNLNQSTDNLEIVYKLKKGSNGLEAEIKKKISVSGKVNSSSWYYSRRKRATEDVKYTVAVAVYVDFPLYTYYSNIYSTLSTADKIDKIKDIVLTMINGVQALYLSPTLHNEIILTVVKLVVFTSSLSHGEFGSNSRSNLDAYLGRFCTWQQNEKPSESSGFDVWDHALLLSQTSSKHHGVKLSFKEICEAESCSLFNGESFTNIYTMTYTLARFMGVTFDRDNDCDEDSKFIMSYVDKTEKEQISGHTEWSNCSAYQLKRYLENTLPERTACLRDEPRSSEKLKDESKLPGQRYSIEEQCKISFGRNWEAANTSYPQYKDVCSGVNCVDKSSGTVEILHAALQGTKCSNTGKCANKQCVEAKESLTEERIGELETLWRKWSDWLDEHTRDFKEFSKYSRVFSLDIKEENVAFFGYWLLNSLLGVINYATVTADRLVD